MFITVSFTFLTLIQSCMKADHIKMNKCYKFELKCCFKCTRFVSGLEKIYVPFNFAHLVSATCSVTGFSSFVFGQTFEYFPQTPTKLTLWLVFHMSVKQLYSCWSGVCMFIQNFPVQFSFLLFFFPFFPYLLCILVWSCCFLLWTYFHQSQTSLFYHHCFITNIVLFNSDCKPYCLINLRCVKEKRYSGLPLVSFKCHVSYMQLGKMSCS